ncbi:unnamed protein product [Brassica napus]|uniref:(rape) hypothetical protein n=1 Tax=Brassica napus TaxID=3708 RepID=A0A816XLF9_BRANA|nr:unnamed protein product [Brassica napus]
MYIWTNGLCIFIGCFGSTLLMLGCFFMLSPGMRGLNPRVANSLKGVKVGPSARRLKMVLILE